MPEMMEGSGPNYDEICGVLEDRLTPVFELLGDRLKSLEEENSELKDIVFKIVSGFGDAVHEHKKGGYSEMLASKYGPDLDEIGGPYSEIYGKDIKDELLEKLMGGEMGEDGIPEFVGGIKAKFGKLRGPAPSGEVEPGPEVQVTENAPAEMKEENQPEKKMKPSGQGGDILESMTSTLKKAPDFLKGRKRSA